MRGIEVAVAPRRMQTTPRDLAGYTPLFMTNERRPHVVLIATLAVNHLTEDPLPDHIQYQQCIAEIANVLHHHAWHPGGFGGAHQFPALFECSSRGHFGGRV